MNPEVKRSLKNHDWSRTLRIGEEKAREDLPKGAKFEDWRIAWALLQDAAFVSRITYSAPPRTGYPTLSAMPDSSDEVTQWQLMSAYLQGHLTSLPDAQNRPPRPSAEEIDRAAAVLDVWHYAALERKGDKSRLKRAVYLKASGVKSQKIRDITGLTYSQLRRGVIEASENIFDRIAQFLN